MGKEIKISARIEKWQNDLLKEKMDNENIKNYSECIRRMIVSEIPGANPEIKKLLKQIVFQQAKLGNNINQIVKNNNSYLYSESDKRELIKLLHNLEIQIQNCLEKF